jgi:hypothetical protein
MGMGSAPRRFATIRQSVSKQLQKDEHENIITYPVTERAV